MNEPTEGRAPLPARLGAWVADPWVPVVSGLIAFTLLSGLASLGRFLPFVPAGWGEIRLWGTTLLVLLAAWQAWRERPPLGEAGWVLLPLGALAAFVVLRSVPQWPGPLAQRYVAHGILLACQAAAIWVLCRDRRMVLGVLAWSILAGVLLFFAGVLGLGQRGYMNTAWEPFSTSVTLYRLAGLGAAAAFTIVLSRQRAVYGPWLAGWVLVSGALVFASFSSLGRIVPFALGGALAWIAVGLSARRRYRLAVAAFLVVAMAAAVFFATPAGKVFTNRYKVLSSQEERFRSSVGRVVLFTEALRVFKTRPLVGVGPEGFRVVETVRQRPDYGFEYRYPHNVVLELLALDGAIGGALLVVALLAPLVPVLRASAASDAALVLAAYLPFALIASLVSGDLYDIRLYWLVALLAPRLIKPRPDP